MKIPKSKGNAFLFGSLIYLLPLSFLAYIVFGLYMVLSKHFRVLFYLFGALVCSVLLVSISSFFEWNLLTIKNRNALYWSFSYTLLLISPWIRFRFPITANPAADIIILLFIFLAVFLSYFGVNAEVAIQIASFTLFCYLAASRTRVRKVMFFIAGVFSFARSIMAGALTGYFAYRSPLFRKALVASIVIVLGSLFLSDSVIRAFAGLLEFLRGEGVYLKGRVTFWLTLLGEANIQLFGNGIGYSAYVLEDYLGFFFLPHNDWLRILVDLGIIPLAALVVSLWMNASRGGVAMVASSMLFFYMLTGNPLSFPTVIAAYLFSINFHDHRYYPGKLGR